MTDQLTMFGDTPVNFPKGVIPSETVYWISNSALQKFIRRGMVEEALTVGRIMFLWRVESLRRRLKVIMLEDIGIGDWPVVEEVGNTLKKKCTKWEVYESLIRKMCGAVKNRDSDDGFNMVLGAQNKDPRFDAPFPDDAEFRWFVDNAWFLTRKIPNVRFEWWEWLELEAEAKGTECLRRVKWLRGHQSTGLHPFYTAMLVVARWDESSDTMTPPTSIQEDPSCRVLTYLDENQVWPDIALDAHVRQGKIALGKVAKDMGITHYRAVEASFFVEGTRLDRWAAWPNDFRTLAPERYFPGDQQQEAQAILANLVGLRQWVFKKILWPSHLKDVDQLQK